MSNSMIARAAAFALAGLAAAAFAAVSPEEAARLKTELTPLGAERGPDVAGGAIFALGRGDLVVVGSRFAGNRASNGGAIGLLGASLSLVNTTIADSTATPWVSRWVRQSSSSADGTRNATWPGPRAPWGGSVLPAT